MIVNLIKCLNKPMFDTRINDFRDPEPSGWMVQTEKRGKCVIKFTHKFFECENQARDYADKLNNGVYGETTEVITWPNNSAQGSMF